MFTSLVVTAALYTAAPLPKDAATATTGPPPRIAIAHLNSENQLRVIGNVRVKRTRPELVTMIENGKPIEKEVFKDVIENEEIGRPLTDLKGKFFTAGGKALTTDDALARLKVCGTLLISSDGEPVSGVWLKAARDDTVVLVAKQLWHFTPYWGDSGRGRTPAPRLTRLGTDDRGRVVAPVTTHPLGSDGKAYCCPDSVFYGSVNGPAWRNRALVDYARVPLAPPPGTAKTVLKPLTDLKFEAFDRDGTPVPRDAALKRLAAGGLVVVAASSQMPDARYLEVLHPELLVLHSAELLLPTEPLDETTKAPTSAPEK